MEEEFDLLDVTVRGPGEPNIVVVGGVHGDERSGIRAVRRLREADLDLKKGVAFVLANPPAIEANERFIDSDLNRVFPGDPEGDLEERIADQLCTFITDRTTLSLHGTRSEPTPFALIHSEHEREFELAAGMSVPYVVDHWEMNEHTITTCGCSVEIEVSIENTEAQATAAEDHARTFLELLDALPGEPPDSNPEFFHMDEEVPKPSGNSYELFVENFEHVAEGEVFASVDYEDVVADESFWPILMSEDGFPDMWGYKGQKIAESLQEVNERWLNDDEEIRVYE